MHTIQKEILLECHVRGEPRPTIEWLKDGLYIVNDLKHFKKYLDDGTCQLFVNSPDFWDSGKYVCRATNRAGEEDCIYVMTVVDPKIKAILAGTDVKKEERITSRHLNDSDIDDDDDDEELYKSRRSRLGKEYDYRYKLKFITHLMDKTVREGSDLVYTCYVDGKFPQFQWYKDDMPIVKGRKYRQKTRRDGKVSLRIINITPDDAGVYKLMAKNYAGEIETSAIVTVFNNPYVQFVPPIFTSTVLGNVFIFSLILECFEICTNYSAGNVCLVWLL